MIVIHRKQVEDSSTFDERHWALDRNLKSRTDVALTMTPKRKASGRPGRWSPMKVQPKLAVSEGIPTFQDGKDVNVGAMTDKAMTDKAMTDKLTDEEKKFWKDAADELKRFSEKLAEIKETELHDEEKREDELKKTAKDAFAIIDALRDRCSPEEIE